MYSQSEIFLSSEVALLTCDLFQCVLMFFPPFFMYCQIAIFFPPEANLFISVCFISVCVHCVFPPFFMYCQYVIFLSPEAILLSECVVSRFIVKKNQRRIPELLQKCVFFFFLGGLVCDGCSELSAILNVVIEFIM